MTDQMQITLSREAHQVLLTNWLRFADSKHPLASEIADAIRNARPVQPSALERLEAWLWKDIENNSMSMEGNGKDYVCWLIVASDSGLEPATSHGDTLEAAVNAALDVVTYEQQVDAIVTEVAARHARTLDRFAPDGTEPDDDKFRRAFTDYLHECWQRIAEIAPDNALIQMHASAYAQEDGAE